MMDFIIGVEGNRTACKAAIATADGRILGRGSGGPANLFENVSTGLRSALHAAHDACDDAGLTHEALRNSFAVLGMTGANAHAEPHTLSRNLPFAATQIVSNTVIALEGAHGEADGVIGILGTGSTFMARNKSTFRYVGGWGFHCGDQGSGAKMGERALEEALLAHDGLRPLCPLTEHILSQFEDDPRKLAEYASSAKPQDFADYMPIILIYARQQNQLALDIVEQGTTYVASALRLLSEDGALPISLLGRLSNAYLNFLPPDLKRALIPPQNDPLRGALAMAERENMLDA